MKKLLVFLAAILLVFAFVGSSAAFYMNFEEGLGNDFGIITGIPGVSFTNSAGLDWIYADVLTDNYNHKSIDTGDTNGTGAYQMYGYVNAWLGIDGNWGRIDFDDQNGTWFQTGLTAHSTPVTLTAYDSANNVLDTAILGEPNLNEDDMAWLRVDAPGGQYISYVTISDSGNYWIVDEMTGDMAGGVPVPEPATMLLLGSGLIGLGILGRKKFFKK